ncbi:unnamed protein product [Lampetra fluviatilis]
MHGTCLRRRNLGSFLPLRHPSGPTITRRVPREWRGRLKKRQRQMWALMVGAEGSPLPVALPVFPPICKLSAGSPVLPVLSRLHRGVPRTAPAADPGARFPPHDSARETRASHRRIGGGGADACEIKRRARSDTSLGLCSPLSGVASHRFGRKCVHGGLTEDPGRIDNLKAFTATLELGRGGLLAATGERRASGGQRRSATRCEQATGGDVEHWGLSSSSGSNNGSDSWRRSRRSGRLDKHLGQMWIVFAENRKASSRRRQRPHALAESAACPVGCQDLPSLARGSPGEWWWRGKQPRGCGRCRDTADGPVVPQPVPGRLHGERSAAPSFRGGSLALRERRRRPCQMYADDDETPAVEADPELRLASGKRS